jgi:hypothetical protein
LGVSLGEYGGKTLTTGVPGRGVHRASTEEFDGILQLHKRCAQRGHNLHLRLLDLRHRWFGWLQQPPGQLQGTEATSSTPRSDQNDFIDREYSKDEGLFGGFLDKLFD